MVNRKVQPVSFNLDDPFESKLYEFALTNGPFSKYIKRLIQRDQEVILIKATDQTEMPTIQKKKPISSSFL